MNEKCEYFKDCGGCSYLDLSEVEYQKIKSQKLQKILDEAEIKIREGDFLWLLAKRRKLILQVGEKNKVGFFQKSSKNLVEIKSCYVACGQISSMIEKISLLMKNIEEDLISHIQITLFDNILDLVFFTKRKFNKSQNNKISEFAKLNKINASYSFKNEIEVIFIQEKNKIHGLELSSDIFVQATKEGLEEIIKIIGKNLVKNAKIADIYCGFGIYSFAIQNESSFIESFEGSLKMIELLAKNIATNSLKNKMKASHRDLFKFPVSWQELKEFDQAIINPPRNGATPQIKEIAASKLKNLIYVSCNPQSFLRDFLILKESGFKIKEIKAIDQFYSTDHFELVAVLTKN